MKSPAQMAIDRYVKETTRIFFFVFSVAVISFSTGFFLAWGLGRYGIN